MKRLSLGTQLNSNLSISHVVLLYITALKTHSSSKLILNSYPMIMLKIAPSPLFVIMDSALWSCPKKTKSLVVNAVGNERKNIRFEGWCASKSVDCENMFDELWVEIEKWGIRSDVIMILLITCPFLSCFSTRWLPINPSEPVTKILFLLTIFLTYFWMLNHFIISLKTIVFFIFTIQKNEYNGLPLLEYNMGYYSCDLVKKWKSI